MALRMPPTTRYRQAKYAWLAWATLAFSCDTDAMQPLGSGGPCVELIVQSGGGEYYDLPDLVNRPYGYGSIMISPSCAVTLSDVDGRSLRQASLTEDERDQLAEILEPAKIQRLHGHFFNLVCEAGQTTSYRTTYGDFACGCGCDRSALESGVATLFDQVESLRQQVLARATPIQIDVGVFVIDKDSVRWVYDRAPSELFVPIRPTFDLATLTRLQGSWFNRVQDDSMKMELRALWQESRIRLAQTPMSSVYEPWSFVILPSGRRYALAIGELAEPRFDPVRP